jgi:hypothetical protein
MLLYDAYNENLPVVNIKIYLYAEVFQTWEQYICSKFCISFIPII